jgi:hypothetical protein
MPGIFINYRRDDAPGVAGRLYDYLAKTFSRRDLFIDVDAIKPGLDFVTQLDNQVSQCDAMLALIGPHWATATDERGRRRLDGDKDYVRIEIAAALRRDIPVIPVLVDGAGMPAEDELPDDLKSLTRRHALELRHTRFSSDASDIAAALRTSLPKRKSRRPWVLAAAAAVLVGFPLVWALYPWDRPSLPEPRSATPASPPPAPSPETSGQTPKLSPPQNFVASGPATIVLAGLGQAADLKRIGADTWEWVENNATFRFRTLLETKTELIIHDESRDMYHRLNLDTGETFWRIGTSGDWMPHYRIISQSMARSGEQTFKNPMAGSLPLDGCLYFARECGEPAASAWCASQGLGKATNFTGFRNVARTQVLGDGAVCTAGPAGVCGTFTSITCSGGG